MRCLRAFTEDCLLRLDKVADFHVTPEPGTRTKVCIWSHGRLIPDVRVLGHRAGFEMNVVAGRDVGQVYSRLDYAARADRRLPLDRYKRIDDRVVADGDCRVDYDRGRVA